MASQGEADGEDRSAFFFLLYAATLQKCLQELGEPERHEIRLGQRQKKKSIKAGGDHTIPGPLHTIPRRQECARA